MNILKDFNPKDVSQIVFLSLDFGRLVHVNKKESLSSFWLAVTFFSFCDHRITVLWSEIELMYYDAYQITYEKKRVF